MKNISIFRQGALLAVSLIAAGPIFAQVSYSLNSNSLSSLSWRGISFLGNGQPSVERADFCYSPGVPQPGNLRSALTVDRVNSAITQAFSWGNVRTSYQASGDTLIISVQVQNTGTAPLCRVIVTPLHLRFPQTPPELTGGNPLMAHNAGQASVLQVNFGSGIAVLANEDVVKPLTMGIPWIDPNLGYPLKLSTGSNPMYPASFPYIDRPIAPGATDQYTVSIRFGAPGSTADTLAADVYQKYAAAHPALFNWPDRRPLGDISVAALSGRSSSNPRGYFNDPSLDVRTPRGQADFRNRILALADRSISVLSSMNAQGVIVWDMEGYEFPGAVYVGDPLQLPRFAPEMNSVADEFFARIRNAGFKVGVTIRMQEATFQPDGSVVQVQLGPAQSVARLISRIQYALNRWGATLFYVDSNDYFDSDIFRQVAAAVPGVLLIPEHSQLMHYLYGAPYIDARFADPCTPAAVRKLYPNAFSMVNFVDLSTYNAKYSRAKSCNEMMLFRGSFTDGQGPR